MGEEEGGEEMKLPLFWAALRDSKLSTIIFCTVLVLYGMLILSAYTSVGETFSDPFAENNGLKITETGEKSQGIVVYNLTWETKAGVLSHVAIGMNSSIGLEQMGEGSIPDDLSDMGLNWFDVMEMLDSIPGLEEKLSDQGHISPVSPYVVDDNGTSIIYLGEGAHVRFKNTQGSDMFVVALIPSDGNISNVTLKGPALLGDLEKISDFDRYLEDNPFVEGFLGDIEVDFSTLEGYLSIEYFSLWPLLFIIFLAVKTSGTVSKHVEDRSMDILLATGYSRVRFLNEKVLLIILNVVLIAFSAWLGLILGIIMVGEPVPFAGMTLAFIDSLPMAFAFLGISLLISVLVDEGGKAIGIIMGVVMGEYILNVVANLASWGDNLKYLSLFTYWNSNGSMIDHLIDPINVIVPMSVAIISFGLAYILFQKKEIHA
jgi:ABC-2 type transport system permease protein